MKLTRREVLKAGLAGGAGMLLPLKFMLPKAHGVPLISGLSDCDCARQAKEGSLSHRSTDGR